MKQRLMVAAVGSALVALTSQVWADGSDAFKLRGFGTVGVVHSSTDLADYRTGLNQPNGAGYSHKYDFGVDSKLGLQADMKANDILSGTIQVISERRYDKTFKPTLEWANAKIQATSDLAFHAGRMALPVYMVSDYRKVGYANPWVRPPTEVYFQVPFSHLDGADAVYRLNTGDVSTTFQAYGGRTKNKIPTSAGMNESEGRRTLGLNVTSEIGSLTLRAGYVRTRFTYQGPATNTFFNSYRALANGVDKLAAGAAQVAAGAQSAGQQPLPAPILTALSNTATSAAAAAADATATAQSVRSIVERYEADNVPASFVGFGALYDPGGWFIQAEYTKRTNDSLVADTTAWYLSGGVRVGKFTPYATYSRIKTDSELTSNGASPISAPAISNLPAIPQLAALQAGIDQVNGGVPQINQSLGLLNGGLNVLLFAGSTAQRNITLGVRWDVMKNMDVKMQWDQLKIDNKGAGYTLNNNQVGFDPGKKINLFSLAVDFVF
ncbi:X-X-X-Leu-X-X-Gly heptad repeat protein [Chitinivorax tropicus]|uniref:X-X-X-Leu-X-X-Gly heptad repeat protein n=1 Tax=Chitinivorax tropicus TaxID=714531 RepID=A0A840MRB9_9PROT|nr:hypothetical protein [Chitinivorax tropicus]MBB5017761.1 X-X-X-Leu-X-X-Gly heptad repeat protein [Chitinivorax tropicus]